ncbi:hypothetical protein RAM80_02695 [Pseudomonas sp. App30]|uniref:hypothetical protein n=1 Tax=Pseudomonas sp. App30 TaxID=3068990 RepID=UPI003A80D654
MHQDTWLDECRVWCRHIKYLSDTVDWAEKPSHSGWLEATSLLLDENRVSIPHLYFKGEYQQGRMGERITYGLMYRQGKDKRRVFMLEVYPQHERSHRENGVVWFGPHCHLGDERLQQVTRSILCSLEGATLHRWVDRFRRHARILDHGSRSLTPPFGRDLFGSTNA